MSVTDPTAAEMLTACNVAIMGLISKQFKTTKVNDREYTLQDIAALRELRDNLKVEVNAATNNPGGVRLGDFSC